MGKGKKLRMCVTAMMLATVACVLLGEETYVDTSILYMEFHTRYLGALLSLGDGALRLQFVIYVRMLVACGALAAALVWVRKRWMPLICLALSIAPAAYHVAYTLALGYNPLELRGIWDLAIRILPLVSALFCWKLYKTETSGDEDTGGQGLPVRSAEATLSQAKGEGASESAASSGDEARRIAPATALPTESVLSSTWDCIWFGTFPQTELTPSNDVYATLEQAAWDERGDTEVDGVRYRRISRGDATNAKQWSRNSAAWRYFRHEAVRWRILRQNGDEALVVSDIALDCRPYHVERTSVTWATCSLRSWLNGYGASANQARIDYSSTGFCGTAFSADEFEALHTAFVASAANVGHGTPGGEDTHDEVFLLGEHEVCGSLGKRYGFAVSHDVADGSRLAMASDYARAMGADGAGGCMWWLRTSGINASGAVAVCADGTMVRNGFYVDGDDVAVRPCLRVNIASPYVTRADSVGGVSGVAEAEPSGDTALQVSFRETVTGTDGRGVYEVYEGPDEESAMAFLNEKPVSEALRYVVVETPEGTFCRDVEGFYREDVEDAICQ